jgi:hypothetical protein
MEVYRNFKSGEMNSIASNLPEKDIFDIGSCVRFHSNDHQRYTFFETNNKKKCGK